MIILLPPSETKTRPTHGPSLDLGALAHPELTRQRETVLRAAQRTAQTRGGAAALKVPPSSPELAERMAVLASEPCAPALSVYDGVLFDALGDAAGDDERTVLITSALFGVVEAGHDLIPAYRLSAGSTVSRLGGVASWWRPHLAPLARRLATQGRVVVDCRSGAYRSMMPVAGAIEVAAVREVAGQRTVVSHDAKRYRGLVARALLTADAAAASTDEVAHRASTGLGPELTIELDTSRTARPVLTVVDRAGA